ncbi:MAG: BlaI/MecI/CopY family transcriptional regulator [Verrucomicrobiota bacterium]
MRKKPQGGSEFSKRESEVMDVMFRKGSATAREVWTELGEHPTYSTIRKILSILEEKGHLTHTSEGQTFIYSPKVRPEKAGSSALRRLIDTFYQGSVAGAVSSLLGDQGQRLSREELDELASLIENAKQQPRSTKPQS